MGRQRRLPIQTNHHRRTEPHAVYRFSTWQSGFEYRAVIKHGIFTVIGSQENKW